MMIKHALSSMLGDLDYTIGCCSPTAVVAAALPEHRLLDAREALMEDHDARPEQRTALLCLLDAVDWTRDACSPFEMVGAVLPQTILSMGRRALGAEAD